MWHIIKYEFSVLHSSIEGTELEIPGFCTEQWKKVHVNKLSYL